MNFNNAVKHLKKGLRVRRLAWTSGYYIVIEEDKMRAYYQNQLKYYHDKYYDDKGFFDWEDVTANDWEIF